MIGKGSSRQPSTVPVGALVEGVKWLCILVLALATYALGFWVGWDLFAPGVHAPIIDYWQAFGFVVLEVLVIGLPILLLRDSHK